MPSKPITSDFYRVHIGAKNDHPLTDILRLIWTERPEATSRNYDSADGDVWRLHDFKVDGKNCRGSLLRIRTDQAAEYADLNTDRVADIPLGPNQHLVQWFAFCYFDEFKILVAHRNRDAGNHLKLAAYIRNLSGAYGVNFEHVMTKDGIRRMNALFTVSKFELKLAVPTSNELLNLYPEDDKQIEDVSVNSLMQMGRLYGGTEITIIVSQGRSKRAIAAKKSKDFLLAALEQVGNNVRSATLQGKKNDLSGTDFVDLIEGRLEHKDTLSYTGKIPTFSDYYRSLSFAYSTRFPELKDQFG